MDNGWTNGGLPDGNHPVKTTKDAEAGEDGKEGVQVKERETWSGRLDFILSCVAFAVGLGNIWRFPYLCYKNGGGSFFIPYLLCLVCCGVPLFMLEVSLGQFMSLGGVHAWNICPLFKGVGYASTVIVFLLNIYYIVVLAWDLTYMGFSFTRVLPWSHCNNTWNTERCKLPSPGDNLLGGNATSYINASTFTSYNVTVGNTLSMNVTNATFKTVDPVIEFWERRILQISDGIDQPNGLVWELALALLIVWVACYFCIWKGVSWSGKVVYLTASFPYVMLLILLIRGVTLDGAMDGIIYYLKPDFTRLKDAQVWIDAGTQIFFSYAIGLGAMVALGSYNKFKNNCYRDVIMISCINSCTSLVGGFVIFSVLGFMAKQQGVGIEDVAESGPGLAFIAYPKAVAQMPLAPLWAVLFFLMILMLGMGSQFVGMEAFVTVMMDMFPSLTKGHRREISIAAYCLVSYLIGLSMVTRGGMYVFQLFDYYSASGMALLWVCTFECIAVAWTFGVRRFYDCIEAMIGFRINCWMMICWMGLTPFVSMFIFCWMWAQFSFPTYNREYVYPAWSQVVGLCLAFSSMVCIPLHLVYYLIVTPGDSLREKFKRAIMPVLKEDRIQQHWPDCSKIQAHSEAYANDDRPGIQDLCCRQRKAKTFHVNGSCEAEMKLMQKKEENGAVVYGKFDHGKHENGVLNGHGMYNGSAMNGHGMQNGVANGHGIHNGSAMNGHGMHNGLANGHGMHNGTVMNGHGMQNGATNVYSIQNGTVSNGLNGHNMENGAANGTSDNTHLYPQLNHNV